MRTRKVIAPIFLTLLSALSLTHQSRAAGIGVPIIVTPPVVMPPPIIVRPAPVISGSGGIVTDIGLRPVIVAPPPPRLEPRLPEAHPPHDCDESDPAAPCHR